MVEQLKWLSLKQAAFILEKRDWEPIPEEDFQALKIQVSEGGDARNGILLSSRYGKLPHRGRLDCGIWVDGDHENWRKRTPTCVETITCAEEFAVPGHEWAASRVNWNSSSLRLQGRPSDAPGASIKIPYGWCSYRLANVQVSAPHLMAMRTRLVPAEGSGVATTGLAEASVFKSKRGPKDQFGWLEIFARLIAIAALDGLPLDKYGNINQKELIKLVQEISVDLFNTCPAPQTIRSKLKLILAQLQKEAAQRAA